MGANYGQTGSQQQSSSTPTDVTPTQIQGLRDPFADTLKSIFAGQGIGYSGPLSAPITSGEQQGIATLQTQATDPTRLALLQKTMQGGFLPGADGSNNPALQSAIEAAQHSTVMGLQKATGRTLPSQFATAGQNLGGQGSSAFDRAKALAEGEGAHALASIGTNMAYQGYENERGRQQQAVQLSQNELTGLNQSLQASSLPRLIQDQGVQRGIETFNSRVQSLLQALSMISSPISQVATTGSSSGSSEGSQYGVQGPKYTPA